MKRKPEATLEKWLNVKKAKVDVKEEGGITFVECKSAGYPARTEVNVQETDATLLLAVDVNTPGEKLTRRYCLENKKPYLVVKIDDDNKTDKTAEDVAVWVKSNNIKALNIAGNCITRFRAGVIQKQLNDLATGLLVGLDLERIQTGGQTGIDQAGSMAALALKIPAKVVAPRGWMFRELNGRDVSSEELFKSRFSAIVPRFYVDVLYYGVEPGSDYGADRIEKMYGLDDVYKEALSTAPAGTEIKHPDYFDNGKAVVETEEFSTREDRDKAHKLLQSLLKDRAKEHHPEPDCVFSGAAIYIRDV